MKPVHLRRCIPLLLLWCLVGQSVSATPMPANDQVVDGSLVTEWGTLDSLDLHWMREADDDGQVLYLGSTLDNVLTAIASESEEGLSGDTYVVLSAENASGDDAERRKLMETYVAGLGSVKSKKWRAGPRPFLTYLLDNGSKGSVAMIKTKSDVVLIAGSGKDHSEKNFQRILSSFKGEDTKEALVKARGLQEATPEQAPTEHSLDGGMTQTTTIELPKGWIWNDAVTSNERGPSTKSVAVHAVQKPITMESLERIFLIADVAALFLLPFLIGLGNRFNEDRQLNPWWTTTLALLVGLGIFMGAALWVTRETMEKTLQLFLSGTFWLPVSVVCLAPALLYILLGVRWYKRH